MTVSDTLEISCRVKNPILSYERTHSIVNANVLSHNIRETFQIISKQVKNESHRTSVFESVTFVFCRFKSSTFKC